MRIHLFLAGLEVRFLPPAGVLLARHPSPGGEARVLASEAALTTALRVPSGARALEEVLGPGASTWLPGPLLQPHHLREVDAEGSLLGPQVADLPWVLLPPDRTLRVQGGLSGTLEGSDFVQGRHLLRHRINLLAALYGRVLADDPVLDRVARNILDLLGHRLG